MEQCLSRSLVLRASNIGGYWTLSCRKALLFFWSCDPSLSGYDPLIRGSPVKGLHIRPLVKGVASRRALSFRSFRFFEPPTQAATGAYPAGRLCSSSSITPIQCRRNSAEPSSTNVNGSNVTPRRERPGLQGNLAHKKTLTPLGPP